MRSDLRDAFRSLTRDRAFAALAILLLSLTGGATAAVYAIVNAVLLQPLVFADQLRTVVIWQRDTARATPVVEVALGQAETWRERTSAFDALGVFGSVNVSITLLDGDTRMRASSSWVSAPFFDVVGIQPALGRSLDAQDEFGNVPRVALVSDAFWRRHFGADPRAVGRTLHMQGGVAASPNVVEIVGVMPPGFDFPSGVDLWLPAAPLIRSVARPDPNNPAHVVWYLANHSVFYALGRLRAGVGLAQAERELTRVIRDDRDRPTGMATDAVVTPIDDYVVGPTKPVLWTMLVGALIMVVLACSSVAGLHVFRSARQDRAIAIQLALGASRLRLMRRSLFESALLASVGALGAYGVAWGLTRVLVAMAPVDVPRLAATSVRQTSVLLVVIVLATVTGVLTGLWPAWFVRRVDVGRTLTSGARTALHPRERLVQRLIVGWQVAVAVVVLCGAALFVRSVQQLDRTPLGFESEGLVSIDLQPSARDFERWDQFFEALLARVEVLPHVRRVGAIALRPLSGPVGNDSIPVLKGQEGLGPDAPWRQNARANLQSVTPGYFPTVGARLLAGRDFTRDDQAAAPNVVMVGASAAARYWPGRDPVGEPILVPTQRMPGRLEQPRWQTVVGVVEDVRYRGVTDPRFDVYLPAAQSTIRVRDVLVRTTGTPAQALADVQTIARELDPGVVVGNVSALTDVVARETAPWRFAMRVLAAFGALAAALATVGLFGLVSLVVALRRRELGIRAALGATPTRLRVHVLTEAVWIAGTATACGVLASLGLGHLLRGLLVDTSTADPVSIAGAAILTLAAAILGCYQPAARAAASDPAEVLRD